MFLNVIQFATIFLVNFYYFELLHFWSLVESENRKMYIYYVQLTKYMLIRRFK